MTDFKVCGELVVREVFLMSFGDLNSLSKEIYSQTAPVDSEGVVSFQAEVPAALQKAMIGFIERHPNWDQYRLIQAALAGFLVQNGVDSRSLTRLYVGNMFRLNSFFAKT